MKEPRKINRGAQRVRKGRCVFVGAWVPTEVVAAVDVAVETMDTDRSKFLRRALEEKLRKEAA